MRNGKDKPIAWRIKNVHFPGFQNSHQGKYYLLEQVIRRRDYHQEIALTVFSLSTLYSSIILTIIVCWDEKLLYLRILVLLSGYQAFQKLDQLHFSSAFHATSCSWTSSCCETLGKSNFAAAVSLLRIQEAISLKEYR